MRTWILLLTMVVSSLMSTLVGHQLVMEPTEASVETFDESIVAGFEGKAYLDVRRMCFYNDQFFVLNNAQQWVSLNRVYQDRLGYYVQRKMECPKKHEGFFLHRGTWYCNHDGCPYHWHKMDR